ncbi:TonB-dependent receptor [Algoriphagus sp. AGSA1]|uniref:TonB-dependent receptor n=1 Tax=Algoriphagus sp. AGSA1 TaxID=2907213 RepID=UPI001F44FAA7|nr:carboxypeptidase-like regulatory domain-containing protein [Algoriphagus sp. AGSA1]MCE7056426.1 TonB-dependent receptor [Algoriphagus sp. AGSA1]
MKPSFFAAFFILMISKAFSQGISVDLKNPTLRDVFQQVENQSNYKFAYDDGLPLSNSVGTDLNIKNAAIDEVIATLNEKLPYNFVPKGKNIAVLLKTEPFQKPKDSQASSYTYSGVVLDEANEPLMGATIYIRERQTGAVTDENGAFSITLSRGAHTARISHIGFSDREITLNLTGDVHETYVLDADGEVLDEVLVTSIKNSAEIKNPQMSMNRLSVAEIKRMPAALGEPDPLKSILQLPGVTNAGEASSGFNVRGGAADQNLILLDGVPILGDSHLFGFFSIFNADALSGLELYKGGIPAGYGGRVSSVLDVHQKTGDDRDFYINGDIGLISSRLMAEGPLKKDQSSFMLAGRSSYAHLFLKLTENLRDNVAYFYDFNAKLSHRLGPNDNLYFSGYHGRDVFNIGGEFASRYGNSVANLRWQHRFSDKLISNLSAMYSMYLFELDLNIVDFGWENSVTNYGLKYDFNHYFSDDFILNYGAQAVFYDFNPGTLTAKGENSSFNSTQLDRKYAMEPAIYIDAEHKFSERFSVRYGARYSLFYRIGSEEIKQYEGDRAVVFNPDFQLYEGATPTGSVHYGSGKTISSFGNIEPRMGISYAFNEDMSVKASYNRMAQYIHLLANTQSPIPINLWTPSGPFIDPQQLDQIALGYFMNFKGGDFSLETEVFHKTVQNRIDYIDGANLIANNAIEQVILNGEARAHGLEVLLKKNTGRLTGWVAYTLSRAEQRTPGRTPEETGIANGEWYRSPYDKLHDISVTGGYQLDSRWTLGANFAFQTGRPVTFPDGQYEFGGIKIPNYGSRNDSRLPAYHHLDLSATYVPKSKKEKKLQGEWVFSLYNVYGRNNAASINFRTNEETGINEAVRLSIFGIVPGISYNFKF